MSHDVEPHTLSGAYAVNAVPEEERRGFERHLERCASCAREVAELTETAARLGTAMATEPPPAMRRAVLERIGRVRQEPPRGAVRRAVRGLPPLALAASLAALLLGGTTAWQWYSAEQAREREASAERLAEELTAVLSSPDARMTTGAVRGGGSATVVVSPDHDRVAFLASGLPAPPEGRVYQLWFADQETMRPAGLLDAGADEQALLMDGRLGEATGMGITVEPAGGSPQPTSEPLALMEFAG
ncbi:anti-sigma factor [Streptomyces sedi]|uniref:Regulator of SigK n=1 Tax=Streptomyces sedi TaxID=555059 RepID=A0A5C4V6Y8_9ACTN|nr:anti-sigma factor [Streptomyces sedi]TNM31563.1 anti-sigma factor [Streptomyces sedi]